MNFKAKNRLLIYLIGVIIVLNFSSIQLLIVTLSLLVLITLFNKNFYMVWRRFNFAIPFFITILFLGLFHVEDWKFSIVLSLKFLIIIILNINLLGSYTENDLIIVMKELKVPNLIIIIVFFIFRYYRSFKEEIDRFILARSLRGGKLKRRFSLKEYSLLGETIGAGVVRSIDRSDKVYKAMKLRGLNINSVTSDE